MYDFRKLTLGIAPTRRDTFPPPEFAVANKAVVMKRLNGIFANIENLEVVTVDGINKEGILVESRDVAKAVKFFREKNVDALFVPHLNFGQEEAVGKIASALNVPVLLWGPRDPRPVAGAPFREFDTQCGLFASSRALSRYGIPFTYIENCWLDSPILDKGINDFIRTASAVKAFRNCRVLQLSTRPRQFLSVKVNESELLEKFGIEVVVLESTYITNCMDEYLSKRPNDIKQRISEWEKQFDFSALNGGKIDNMAALELAIENLAETYDCPVVSSECWQLFMERYGIRTCFVFGDCTQRGLPVACENDIHGSITSAILMGATRMQTPTFLADLTVRHPDNDNAELLWHCGPFPGCLAKAPGKPTVKGDGLGFWELKGGDITIARFDAGRGKYSFFVGEGRGIDGPGTDGNYVWFETDDWIKWEKKLIYGPYIHHVAGAHGKYKDALFEVCKYLGDVALDTPDPV